MLRRSVLGMITGAALALSATSRSLGAQEVRSEQTERSAQSHDAELAVLRRVVKRFEFEEASRAPIDMPPGFFRLLSFEAQSISPAIPDGFPPYGEMRLSRDAAHTGDWSLRFDLQAGSMAARTATGVCPILPGADYEISVWVRSQDLVHSRLRLAAWLHDVHGNPIAASRMESAAIASDDRWTRLRVVVAGDFESAADLVMELQLLQPRHVGNDGGGGGDGGPGDIEISREDVRGVAWFDDLVVCNVPRTSLATTSSLNVFEHPARPEISIEVRDTARSSLVARLRVLDVRDRTAHEETLDVAAGRLSIVRTPALTQFGWYRAVLDVIDGEEIIASQSLSFVSLPPAKPGAHNDRFGLALPPCEATALAAQARLTAPIGAAHILVPVLHENLTAEGMSSWMEALQKTIDQFVEGDRRMTLSLDRIPPFVADELQLESSQVLAMLSGDSSRWPQALTDLLATYGLQVDRWQVGELSERSPLHDANRDEALRKAHESLCAFVMNPVIVLPTLAEHEASSISAPASRCVIAPANITAGGMERFIAAWAQPDDAYSLLLTPPDARRHSKLQRIVDVAQGALSAWRFGAPAISIEAPWRCEAGTESIEIDPAYVMWSVLSRELNHRTFLGELSLGEGLHAWILRGEGDTPSAIVAWSGRVEPAGDGRGERLSMRLAGGDVTAIDLQGNRRVIELNDAVHEIALDAAPQFIIGIDPHLALFRSKFAVSPSRLSAEARAIEASVVLDNPWPTLISGTIRFDDVPGVSISPRQQAFVVPVGESASLPITLMLDRSAPAGRKNIEAVIDLNGGAEYALRVRATLEVGLDNLQCSASWRLNVNEQTGRRDLVVSVFATNMGARDANLDVVIRGPQTTIKQPLASGLPPGQSATRTFRVEGGAALLSGETLLVGVAERDGVARYNIALDIPVLEDR